MPRGRRPIPDEIHALKGNPSKRKLFLTAPAATSQLAAKIAAVQIPEFLTNEREKIIFRRVIEDYLQRRIARPLDATAYGRWACYLHLWMTYKEMLDQDGGTRSAWYESSKRRDPMLKDQLDLERVLWSLEDRLGLNPIARQNIIRGLAAMPAAFRERDEPQDVSEDGPLGFLQSAGSKPH